MKKSQEKSSSVFVTLEQSLCIPGANRASLVCPFLLRRNADRTHWARIRRVIIARRGPLPCFGRLKPVRLLFRLRCVGRWHLRRGWRRHTLTPFLGSSQDLTGTRVIQ